MNTIPQRLFVYGSLAPGESNAHMLQGLRGTWQPAYIHAEFIESAWGDAAGFPGIHLDANAPRVGGQIFTSQDLAEHWSALDAFEGAEYRRVLTEAITDQGEQISAYVYELLPAPTSLD
jgi:gamma-glutamylcyclotransferase (GGCT)/AIG2-like uncharacterized protein YtfP